MRRAYVRLLVSNVTVNDNEIVIAGSKAALENAAQKDIPEACAAVPICDQQWCAYRTRTCHHKPQKYWTFGSSENSWSLCGPPLNSVLLQASNPGRMEYAASKRNAVRRMFQPLIPIAFMDLPAPYDLPL